MHWTPGDKPYHEAMSRSGAQAHRERLKYGQAYPHDLAIELYVETLPAEPLAREVDRSGDCTTPETRARAGERGKTIIEHYRNRLNERKVRLFPQSGKHQLRNSSEHQLRFES